MSCQNCGASLRESAKFCPECGLSTVDTLPLPTAEYSYETVQKLYSMKATIQIALIIGLPFTGIGVLVALAEGFWFVPVIMGGIVLFAVFIAAWMNKGKTKKWGAERTLWILTPEGYGTGYPPDVSKRIGVVGAVSAGVTAAGKQNFGVTSQGINMAQNLATAADGLPIVPWTEFISAEYRAEKREIALHMPTGSVGLIYANPDNYAYVEQLVRLYMRRND